MNIVDLGICLIDVYLKIDDDESKKNFALSCKYFYSIKKSGDNTSETYQFIIDHFQLIKGSSSITEFRLTSRFSYSVIIFGEMHMSDYHRKINSELINRLWDPKKSEIYTETGNDIQISFVKKHIKKQINCWDIESEYPLLSGLALDSMCRICKTYLECYKGNRFDFNKFLVIYINIIQNLLIETSESLDDFFDLDCIKTICDKGANQTDPPLQKMHLIDLIKQLRNKGVHLLEKLVNGVLSRIKERDISLVDKSYNSYFSGKIPIIVAGLSHTTSSQVQNMAKDNRITCIALKPNNSDQIKKMESCQKEIEDENRAIYEILDTLDAISDSWSEFTSIARFMKEHPYLNEIEQFYWVNKDLFVALNGRMGSYILDLDEIWVWADVPKIIYLGELIRLGATIN